MPTLFDPLRIGAIEAPNRIVMAPMTRARGTREHLPTPIMATYYAQRASAGLILSEAIGVSQQGLGWPHATGLWSPAQVIGWRQVTGAVHAAGGRILAQLWHMGRVVHPSFLGGAPPVSASATTAPGFAHTYDGKQPYTEVRPLRADEVPALLADFRAAARHAIEAGFDGVQIHAANGYLIDQFLRDGTNHRDDAYGGSIDKRVRLLREVTAAVAEGAGVDRTGVRLSLSLKDQGVEDSDPGALSVAAAEALSSLGIAHLEWREPAAGGHAVRLAPRVRTAFKGPLILNLGYDATSGQAALDAGLADAIALGRPFISNPDLPYRMAHHLPLTPDREETWYTQGEDGYLDYPTVPRP